MESSRAAIMYSLILQMAIHQMPRASKYVNNTGSASQSTPAPGGPNTRTDAMPVQAAADGNSGFHLQLTNANNIYAQTGVYFMLNASDKYLVSEDAVQIDGPDASVFLVKLFI